MSALASLERFGEEDPFFINWRSCRHCLQSEWPLGWEWYQIYGWVANQIYSTERTRITRILGLDTNRAMQNSCKWECSNLLFTQIFQIPPPTAKYQTYQWDHFRFGNWDDFYSVYQQYPMILFQPMCNT